MIDDLSTRAALTVAALLMMATGLSVTSLSGGSEALHSAQALGEHVARALDAIGAIDAEMRVLFGPGVNAGVQLPGEVGGHPYRVEIRAADVRVAVRDALVAEPLHIRVHPFPPDGAEYAEGDPRDSRALSFLSGASFQVVRTALLVEGRLQFLTFVFAA